ncbi:hypothetical protein DAVIS_02045 [Mycobacterium marinum]|uniref:Uncharacterized protein n=1 Tax=Mycobacterium marinum TaxID=1781 RepID=A0A3E2MXR6_MYCMR|nr:hypothetical protein DAVIS_02045 [Mycobacterium marinum]
MWTSRASWLAAVREWAGSPGFDSARGAARVSITPATLVAIAVAMADYADHATGRHVAVTRATVAAAARCSPDTVTVAWRLLRVSGWAVEAQRGHGSPGTPAVGRRPSVYHLVPRRNAWPVSNPDLPPSGGLDLFSPVRTYSPSAPQRAEHISNQHPRRYRAEPRPLPVQRLAAALVADAHGLHRGHIGAVCDAIIAVGINPEAWSARAITEALNTDMKTRGSSWPDLIARPGAFLASRLRRLKWPPEGPPPVGSKAADCQDSEPPRAPLSLEQRGRIEAARAEIRAVLTSKSKKGPHKCG